MRNLDTKIRCYRKKNHLLDCKILELEIKLAECDIDYSAECQKKNCEMDYCCDVFQTHLHKEFQELKHCVCCKADYARCLQALYDAKGEPEPDAKDAVVHVGKVPLPPVAENKIEVAPKVETTEAEAPKPAEKVVQVDASEFLGGAKTTTKDTAEKATTK